MSQRGKRGVRGGARGVTVICYRCVTGVLQECYRGFTGSIHGCYNIDTGAQSLCLEEVTVLFHASVQVEVEDESAQPHYSSSDNQINHLTLEETYFAQGISAQSLFLRDVTDLGLCSGQG